MTAPTKAAMQSEINDGGPASEMSVRDVFAAYALQGSLPNIAMYSAQLASMEHETTLAAFMAALAYQLADAMLKAR